MILKHNVSEIYVQPIKKNQKSRMSKFFAFEEEEEEELLEDVKENEQELTTDKPESKKEPEVASDPRSVIIDHSRKIIDLIKDETKEGRDRKVLNLLRFFDTGNKRYTSLLDKTAPKEFVEAIYLAKKNIMQPQVQAKIMQYEKAFKVLKECLVKYEENPELYEEVGDVADVERQKERFKAVDFPWFLTPEQLNYLADSKNIRKKKEDGAPQVKISRVETKKESKNEVVDLKTPLIKTIRELKKKRLLKESYASRLINMLADVESCNDISISNSWSIEFLYSIGNVKNVPLDVSQWAKCLDIYKKFIRDDFEPKFIDDEFEFDLISSIVLSMERLNRDFMKKSIEIRHLVSKERSDLRSFYDEFIKLVERYAEKYKAHCKTKEIVGYKSAHISLCLILLEYEYSDPKQEALGKVLKICKDIKDQLSDESSDRDSKDLKRYYSEARLYSCISLAINGRPLASKKILSTYHATKNMASREALMFNRAVCYTGMYLFFNGYYSDAYKAILNFVINPSNVNLQLGQDPKLFPPWMLIKTEFLRWIFFISHVMLDLPALSCERDCSKELSNETRKRFRDRDRKSDDEIFAEILKFADHLTMGEWEDGLNLITRHIGKFVPDNVKGDGKSGGFFENFERDVKTVSLVCFLVKSNYVYDNIDEAFLTRRFELDNAADIIKRLFDEKKVNIGKSVVHGILCPGRMNSGFIDLGDEKIPLDNTTEMLKDKLDKFKSKMKEMSEFYSNLQKRGRGNDNRRFKDE